MSEKDSLIEFPTDFPIKALGKNTLEFQGVVIDLVMAHAPDLDPTLITVRESGGGRYLAVTVTIRATSRAQLDAIYQSLTDDERVVMAL